MVSRKRSRAVLLQSVTLTHSDRTRLTGMSLRGNFRLKASGLLRVDQTLIRLLGDGDRDSYFTSTERSRIVNEILARTMYGDRRKGEVGIDRLLKEGVYTAAYPLHEVDRSINISR